MWKEYISALLGLGVAGVAFLGLAEATQTWTITILGMVIVVLSLWKARMWEDYLGVALGVCVAGVPLLNLAQGALTWTLGILGFIVLAIELWEVREISTTSDYRQESLA